jgi:pyrroloquinoline-quinone synthase
MALARERTPAPTLSDGLALRLLEFALYLPWIPEWGHLHALAGARILECPGGAIMTSGQFFEQLDTRIAKYDLLCHPFYQAWSAGELTREDLQEYARDYYHHVEAFPIYLAELGIRLDESELRQAVLANMADEKGMADASGDESTSHSELWLDFAEGMGARRDLRGHIPVPEIRELTAFFHFIASEGTAEEALAAFYAYESQVPRVSKEKARGLREMYGADERVTAYFALHTTADVFHSQVWRQQLEKRLKANPQLADKALAAGENAAKALWRALDGIEARRMQKAAA